MGARRVTAIVGTLVLALALAVFLRFSGILPAPPPLLPDLPHVAPVVPGVIRAGQPEEADLVRLRDGFGAVAIVDVGGQDDARLSAAAERAVTESLGMRHLSLEAPPDGLPPADQVAALRDLLAASASTEDDGGLVVLHDQTGRGPVLLAAALVELLSGRPLASAQRHLQDRPGGARPAQADALRQLAETVDRAPP